MIWLEALNDAWDELAETAPVARQFRSKLISTDVPIEIRAGMRAVDDAPCLMLQTTLSPDALFELGGMRLAVVPDTSGAFLVLSLEDSARRDLFSTICADVVTAAAQAERSDALSRFVARLDAWRQFLKDRRDGLSRFEIVGLIGELAILERLLATSPNALDMWESPRDGLHDFANAGHSLEIKSSLGPAASITVSKLDQLDTKDLPRLDLLHVRLVEAKGGRALRDIIEAVRAYLPQDAARRDFENAVLRRGLLPTDEAARNAPRVQLRSIDAYSILEGFPCLVRSNLPLAITEASYTLEVRAISAFSADANTILNEFVQRDQS